MSFVLGHALGVLGELQPNPLQLIRHIIPQRNDASGRSGVPHGVGSCGELWDGSDYPLLKHDTCH